MQESRNKDKKRDTESGKMIGKNEIKMKDKIVDKNEDAPKKEYKAISFGRKPKPQPAPDTEEHRIASNEIMKEDQEAPQEVEKKDTKEQSMAVEHMQEDAEHSALDTNVEDKDSNNVANKDFKKRKESNKVEDKDSSNVEEMAAESDDAAAAAMMLLSAEESAQNKDEEEEMNDEDALAAAMQLLDQDKKGTHVDMAGEEEEGDADALASAMLLLAYEGEEDEEKDED